MIFIYFFLAVPTSLILNFLYYIYLPKACPIFLNPFDLMAVTTYFTYMFYAIADFVIWQIRDIFSSKVEVNLIGKYDKDSKDCKDCEDCKDS